MSRRRRARRAAYAAGTTSGTTGTRSTAGLIPEIEVHGQALPEDLAEPLARVASLLRAKVYEAERLGGTPQDANLDEVYTLLGQQPRLTRWLNAAQQFQAERQRAIAEARGDAPVSTLITRGAHEAPGAAWAGGGRDTDWITQRASPTGRVTGIGSRWTSNDRETYKDTADAVASPGWLRKWAESSVWVRNAINCRRVQIGRSFVACVPKNVLKPYNRQLMKRINRLLQQPNEARQNWRELMEMVVEDLLVLDRGCISKNMTAAREPLALYAEDGATIRVYPGWSGDAAEPRYLYVSQDNKVRIPLRNDQLICIMDNPATHRMGLSPVQVLADIIEADLQAVATRARMVAQKPPPAIVQLPGEQRNQIRGIAADYEANYSGQKEMLFLGGEQAMNVFKLINSSRDDQLMEWQEYICRLIAITFKLSPSQFGAPLHATEGDATTNVQMFEDTGLLPLLMLIEDYLNRELLADFAPRLSGDPFNRDDLEALNLEIKFPEVGEQMRQMHAEKAAELAAMGLLQLPSFTLNQILSMRGEELVPGGNTFYVNTSMGPVPWLSYDGADPSMNPLLAMTMAAMDSDADTSAGKSTVALPKPGGTGQAGGSDNSSGTGKDNPPGKPAGAAKPRDSVQKPQSSPAQKPSKPARPKKSLAQEQQEADLRRLVDGRPAGRPWQPADAMLRRALDTLTDETFDPTHLFAHSPALDDDDEEEMTPDVPAPEE